MYIVKANITDANAGHLDLLLFQKEMRSRESCYISLNTLNIYFESVDAGYLKIDTSVLHIYFCH